LRDMCGGYLFGVFACGSDEGVIRSVSSSSLPETATRFGKRAGTKRAEFTLLGSRPVIINDLS